MSTLRMPTLGKLTFPSESSSDVRPFNLRLAELDVPTPMSPSGAGGKPVMVTSDAAEKFAPLMINKPVRIAPKADKHFVVDGEGQKRLAQVYGHVQTSHVTQEGGRKFWDVSGIYYANENPDLTNYIMSHKDAMGGSYEIGVTDATDTGDAIQVNAFNPTGLAILDQKDAAYQHLTKMLYMQAMPQLMDLAAEVQEELIAMYELTELLARAAGLPLQSNMTYPWDGSKAHQRVIAWATTDGKIDKAKASQGFGYVTGDGSKSGDYHFGFCDVINGRLEVIHNALQTCLSSLNGGRTGQKVVPAAEVPALINFFEGQLKRFHTKQTNAESGTPQGDGGAGEEEGYDPLAAAQDAHLADSQGDNQDASSEDGRERIAMPDGNEALVKRIEEQTAVILKAQARIEALEEAGRQRDESTKEERALLAQAGVGTVVDLFTKIQAEGAEKDATIAELTQKLSDAEKAREELQAQKDVADAEVQAAKGSQMYAEVRKRYAEDLQPKIEAVCMKRARHEELTEEDFNVWAQVSLPATPPDGTAVPTPKPMEVTAGRDGSIAELCDPIYAEAEKLQGEGKFVDAGAKNRWVYERLDAVQAFRNGAK